MSEVMRLYRYKSLLSVRTAFSAEDLMAALEISRATLKRDIAKLRDQLHVPIEFNCERGGYQLEQDHSKRLSHLIAKHGLASQDLAQRIRIVHAGKRQIVAKSFELVAVAIFAAKGLQIWHMNCQNGITTEREVLPQGLVN